MDSVSCDVAVLKRPEEPVRSLTQGWWVSQARSRAGKPRAKREVCRPVLSEISALDRPKGSFNIKLLLVLKLIGCRRKSVQNIQEKSTFFILWK